MLPNGYKDFMKEKISEYYNIHHKLPQKNDLKELSVEPLIFEYGKWKYALYELGFINEETAEEEFNRLVELQNELNGLPSFEEAKDAGINIRLLTDKYGNWRNVKNELKKKHPKKYGIKKTKLEEFNKKIEKDEELIKDITIKYLRIPTVKMAINNGVEINRILKKYGTWKNTKKMLNIYEIYEEHIIQKIKELETSDENKILKEFKKTKYIYKPDLKPLISNFGSWRKVCEKFEIKNNQYLSIDEEKIIEESLKNLKMIEKIIGEFPKEKDVENYEVNVELLLKKYETWENVKEECQK